MNTDSVKVVEHAPYKIIQPKVRIETPLGAIEADTGSHVMDGTIVIAVVFVLYAGKKIIDKHFRSK